MNAVILLVKTDEVETSADVHHMHSSQCLQKKQKEGSVKTLVL